MLLPEIEQQRIAAELLRQLRRDLEILKSSGGNVDLDGHFVGLAAGNHFRLPDVAVDVAGAPAEKRDFGLALQRSVRQVAELKLQLRPFAGKEDVRLAIGIQRGQPVVVVAPRRVQPENFIPVAHRLAGFHLRVQLHGSAQAQESPRRQQHLGRKFHKTPLFLKYTEPKYLRVIGNSNQNEDVSERRQMILPQ